MITTTTTTTNTTLSSSLHPRTRKTITTPPTTATRTTTSRLFSAYNNTNNKDNDISTFLRLQQHQQQGKRQLDFSPTTTKPKNKENDVLTSLYPNHSSDNNTLASSHSSYHTKKGGSRRSHHSSYHITYTMPRLSSSSRPAFFRMASVSNGIGVEWHRCRHHHVELHQCRLHQRHPRPHQNFTPDSSTYNAYIYIYIIQVPPPLPSKNLISHSIVSAPKRRGSERRPSGRRNAIESL